ncbi:DUF2147 domain-containing protein [Roseibium sp. RKSG952]|uniref:DUF2147 domain-containing protein n=1 Tax=Roseibium sp. RKSG952 TaxID=2529384 RepID=UPI0012BB89F6|nr:DUF2147 domain-containing protein [Roseibium sp. RKSG952]MTH95324.1 DUF2147 domain-containing protein [Roseibium sp. RKSG952]
MLKSTLAALALGAGLAMTFAAPSFAADAKGEWIRPSGASKIQINSCSSGLCGKIVWMKQPRNDTKNPNASLRKRSLVGVEIIQSMKPTGKSGQWKGKVYNGEDGKTYTGFIQMTSANKLKLEGCVMGGLICKGETWTRVK